ncbi:hypothetical protein SEA_KLEVEY_26 [Arthrobacter phage Klevey]|uniref:Uncharacterized protein n=1 Tax=Arthrobacter phage Klevey TaxID=2867481 RepID=A0AAE8XKB9_9CAUD|nr:hypothetical protein SEA_KLEVEY_26 [Arthrobacter phage Klevey]
MLDKLFGWVRFKLTDEEIDDASSTKARAEEIAAHASAVHAEASTVGERQRQLRRENHFGQKLDYVYRNAS